MRTTLTCATLALFLTAACGTGDSNVTDCSDGIDNDGDGYIDEADIACTLGDGTLEAPDPPQCEDLRDNDGDSLIDGADYGCEGDDDDDETDPVRQCNDGDDNDGDGRIDFGDDPGCDSPVDADEYSPPLCSDSMDNDGDAIIDYPFDPGCVGTEDDDETDPDPLPACFNGVDDDGDTFVDSLDPGCTAASDDDEYHFIPDVCGPSIVVNDLVGGEAMGSVSGPLPNELTSPDCNGFGGENVYAYNVAAGPVALVISTDYPETTLDTVVYARITCQNPDTELGCDDDGGAATGTSSLILPDVPTGLVYIVVDAYGPGSLGDFKLTVDERPGLHGACDPSMPDDCVPGLICQPITTGAPNTCEYPRCQDGLDNDADTIIDFPLEPGCDSEDDNNETDPVPLPQCGNGLDDDADGLIDYTGGDPGCDHAGDGAEIDECVPGASVIDHPGGAVAGTTVGGSNVLGSPGTCGSTTTATTPERVYYFDFTTDLSTLTFATSGALDAVLYLRHPDCGVAGPTTECNESAVTLTDPPPGGYYAVVDGKSSATGAFTLTITGTVDLGGVCDPASTSFVCEAGTACGASLTCEPAACNDGLDNDGDLAIDYPFEPGCTSISDADEADPVPAPQCGNGLDDDLDGQTDYPMDDSCSAASDDDESCLTFGTDAFGYIGCQDTFVTSPCEDISATGTIVCTGDDCNLGVALPWTFDFYGVGRTTATVGSNGKIAFPGTTGYTNSCTIEDATIAPWWDDLDPTEGGEVRYQLMGTAPDRYLVVNWKTDHNSPTSASELFDIRARIHETGDIEFCYVDTTNGNASVDNGASATIGIKDTGTNTIQFSCNTASVTPGTLLRFLHP